MIVRSAATAVPISSIRAASVMARLSSSPAQDPGHDPVEQSDDEETLNARQPQSKTVPSGLSDSRRRQAKLIGYRRRKTGQDSLNFRLQGLVVRSNHGLGPGAQYHT